MDQSGAQEQVNSRKKSGNGGVHVKLVNLGHGPPYWNSTSYAFSTSRKREENGKFQKDDQQKKSFSHHLTALENLLAGD